MNDAETSSGFHVRLTLDSFGRIHHAEVELRPLTVFVGPNNTNKSWAAYAATSLLSELTPQQSGWSHTDWVQPSALAQVRDVAEQVSSGRVTEGRLSLRRDEILAPGAHVLRQNRIHPSFQYAPPEAEARLELTEDEIAPGRVQGVELRAVGSTKADGIRWTGQLELDGEVVSVRGRTPEQILSAAAAWLFELVVVLPIDRVIFTDPGPSAMWRMGEGYMTSPFRESMGRVLDRDTARREPPPLGGWMPDWLREAASSLVGQVQWDSRDEVRIGSFTQGASASMLRSLAPLALYLERARPGDWVVLDEPEMNAHPRAQLAIAELLACMVNAGLRLVITTHSPYLVDHLSNLMAASSLPHGHRDDKKLVGQFALRTPHAFVRPELVSAYLFDDRKDHVEVLDILDRENAAIDTRTFAEPSDRLGQLFSEILRKQSA